MSYFQDKTLRVLNEFYKRLSQFVAKASKANRKKLQSLCDDKLANLLLDARQGLPSDIFDRDVLNHLLDIQMLANNLGYPRSGNVVTHTSDNEYSFDTKIGESPTDSGPQTFTQSLVNAVSRLDQSFGRYLYSLQHNADPRAEPWYQAFQRFLGSKWSQFQGGWLVYSQNTPTVGIEDYENWCRHLFSLQTEAVGLGFPEKLGVVDRIYPENSAPFFSVVDPHWWSRDAASRTHDADFYMISPRTSTGAVMDEGYKNYCDFNVSCAPDGSECTLTARASLMDSETGETRSFDRTVALSPIIQRVADWVAQYHARLHAQGSPVVTSGFDDIIQNVLHTARQLAQSKVAREVFSEAEPLLALTVPGGVVSYNLLKHSQTVVTKAKAGDPESRAHIHELTAQANAGDPVAHDTLRKMSLISHAQDAKAYKVDEDHPASLWMRGLGRRRSDRHRWGIVTIGHDPVALIGARESVRDHRAASKGKPSGNVNYDEAIRRGYVKNPKLSAFDDYQAALKYLQTHPANYGYTPPVRKALPSGVVSTANPYTNAAPPPNPYGTPGAPGMPYNPMDPYGGYGGVPGYGGYGMPYNPMDPYGGMGSPYGISSPYGMSPYGMDPYGMGMGVDPFALSAMGMPNPLDPYGLMNNPLLMSNPSQQVYDPVTQSFYSNSTAQKYDPGTDTFYPTTNPNPYNPYDQALQTAISGWFYSSPYRGIIEATLQPGPVAIHRAVYNRGLAA